MNRIHMPTYTQELAPAGSAMAQLDQQSLLPEIAAPGLEHLAAQRAEAWDAMQNARDAVQAKLARVAFHEAATSHAELATTAEIFWQPHSGNLNPDDSPPPQPNHQVSQAA